MIGRIAHVGVTVSDIDSSIIFYRDVVGLKFEGEITMQGKETDILFGGENVVARVAYLNGGNNIITPPVELICFESGTMRDRADLNKTSISEICFETDDIMREYKRMKSLGVEFLSEPQDFDFTKDGFGKSKAVYFRDTNGIILELMQYI